MKKISAADRKKLDRFRAQVAKQEAKLAAAIGKYNGTVEAAYAKFAAVVKEYRVSISEIEEFVSQTWWAMADVPGEAPDGWEDTDEAEAHQKWMDAWEWENFSRGAFHSRPPEPLAMPDPPLSELIASIPLSPGEVKEAEETPAVEPEKPSTDLSKQHRSATIREDWRRIADWAAKNLPPGSFRLAEGASREQVDAAEAILGFALPDDVRESFRAHDGSDETPFPYIGVLNTLAFIAQDYAMRRSWGPGFCEQVPDDADAAIKPVWWSLSRVQLTDDGAGDGLMTDLDPAEGGTPGQVIHHDHETGPSRVYAGSWGELLGKIADDAEAGRYACDEDDMWKYVDRQD